MKIEEIDVTYWEKIELKGIQNVGEINGKILNLDRKRIFAKDVRGIRFLVQQVDDDDYLVVGKLDDKNNIIDKEGDFIGNLLYGWNPLQVSHNYRIDDHSEIFRDDTGILQYQLHLDGNDIEEISVLEKFCNEEIKYLSISPYNGKKNIKIPKSVNNIKIDGDPTKRYLYFEIDSKNIKYESINGNIYDKDSETYVYIHFIDRSLSSIFGFGEDVSHLEGKISVLDGEKVEKVVIVKSFRTNYVSKDLESYSLLFNNNQDTTFIFSLNESFIESFMLNLDNFSRQECEFSKYSTKHMRLVIDGCKCKSDFKGLYNFFIEKLTIVPMSDNEREMSCSFENCKIGTLIIEEGIDNIKNNAFKDCKIDKIIIRGKNVSIGDSAFCHSQINQFRVEGSIYNCSNNAFKESKIQQIEVNDLLADAKHFLKKVEIDNTSLCFKDPGVKASLLCKNNVIELTKVIEDKSCFYNYHNRNSYQEKINSPIDKNLDSEIITLSTNVFPVLVEDYTIHYYDNDVEGSKITIVVPTKNNDYSCIEIHVRESRNIVTQKLIESNVPYKEISQQSENV